MDRWPYGSIEDLQESLRSQAYLADRPLATAIYLAVSLHKPLLLEGEAGVGKTEVAKALASALDRSLIRLQCYEGIDAAQALYEWNYSRQLIAVRALQTGEADLSRRVDDLFGEEFLLEVLSEFAVTIPEVGRVAADRPPAVVITSNRTRELHDALKRRCLYHWIDHPTIDREVQSVRVRAPEAPEVLARQVAHAVARLRAMD